MKFNIFSWIKNAFKKKQYVLPAKLSGPAKKIVEIIDDEIAKSAKFGLEILEEHQLKEKYVILLAIEGLTNISGPSNQITFDVTMQFFSEAIRCALEDELEYYFKKLKKEGSMTNANMYLCHLSSVAGRILNAIYNREL